MSCKHATTPLLTRLVSVCLWIGIVATGLAMAIPVAAYGSDGDSTCYGTPERGRLEGGVSLPASGPNFRAFSGIAWAAGRTFVHRAVRNVVVETYSRLAGTHAGTTWVFGDTGWPRGGRIAPHRTHQNGTSVDFFVPVRDREGRPATLPLDVSSRFGYGLEFDRDGRIGDLSIDFPAVCSHLALLREEARRHGIPVERVIFAPELVANLRGTPECDAVREAIPWSTKRPWVRHDEHYHVDFGVRCSPFAR